ncbi:MAG TPA: 1-deoxy-D-xylulose-5-phosphate reductoisomerase [Armatimonadota bacterium]|jgi:1-deoxy-D-xylulose-5-phosphate reductoisomerase
MKSICLLGSTGSIGRQTLDIVAAFPERFSVYALTAHSQVGLLAEQAKRCGAQVAVIMREELAGELRAALAGTDTRVLAGMSGLLEVASAPECDLVLTAMVGAIGLRPLLAAIEAGKTIALANKEPLVAAGALVMAAVARYDATLLPVDSEPSAIFQCLQGQHRGGVARILLTASGGALKHLTTEELACVTPEQALCHPTWAMGPKITIDSATLMNKGLEVIEAHWLFNVPIQDIQIIIHPQSIVHSMVEFRDGSLLAQLGTPTMRTPIQYALGYPERLPHNWAPLDLFAQGTLTFAAPDFSRFPCPLLAQQAALVGGTMPTCLNAANEVAVAAFLAHQICFSDIPTLVERALAQHASIANPTLDDVLATDHAVREEVASWTHISHVKK